MARTKRTMKFGTVKIYRYMHKYVGTIIGTNCIELPWGYGLYATIKSQIITKFILKIYNFQSFSVSRLNRQLYLSSITRELMFSRNANKILQYEPDLEIKTEP